MKLNVPNKFRYFLATPFMVIADLFSYLSIFVMGEENARFRMISDMQDIGWVEVLSLEEYEAKYGKLPTDEQENND